jgi:hypothetical protein
MPSHFGYDVLTLGYFDETGHLLIGYLLELKMNAIKKMIKLKLKG